MSKTSLDQNIRWIKIPVWHWALLLAFIGLVGVAVWQSILPFKAERHFRDGYNFLMAKRYKYAIEELLLAQKYAPWETHYQVQLGRAYADYAKTLPPNQQSQIYLKLIDLYSNMILLDDRNAWYQSRLANAYDDLSRLVVAEKRGVFLNLADKHNRRATELDPQNPLFLLNYAYFLHQKGDNLDEAEALYKRVIEIDERMIEASFNLADLYRKKGELQKSLAYYKKIEQINPEFKNLHIALGNAYLAVNQVDFAMQYYLKAVRAGDVRPEIMQNLAAIFFQKQRWAEAAEFYARLFSMKPDTRPAFLQYYVQALVGAGQLDKAQGILESELEQNPQNNLVKQQLNALKAYREKQS